MRQNRKRREIIPSLNADGCRQLRIQDEWVGCDCGTDRHSEAVDCGGLISPLPFFPRRFLIISTCILTLWYVGSQPFLRRSSTDGI